MNILMRRRELISSLSEPIKYLYINGDRCTGVTGGWLASTASAESGLAVSNNAGKCNFQTGAIQFVSPTTAGYSNPMRTSIVTAKKIDTRGFTKLYVEWAGALDGSKHGMNFALYNSRTAKETAFVKKFGQVAKYNAYNYSLATTHKQIAVGDISSYQGEYYIGAYWYKAADVASTHYAWIFRIWLEK